MSLSPSSGTTGADTDSQPNVDRPILRGLVGSGNSTQHLHLVSEQGSADTSTASYESLLQFLIESLMSSVDETVDRYSRIREVLADPMAAAALSGTGDTETQMPTSPDPQMVSDAWVDSLATITAQEHEGVLAEWYGDAE